jgi:hypothetical protein
MLQGEIGDTVRYIVLGKAINIDEKYYPAVFIQFKTEENETPSGMGNTDEQDFGLNYDISIAITENTITDGASPEDFIDDIKYKIQNVITDDIYLMKGLPDFDPNGFPSQGLSSGVFYQGTVAIYSGEGQARPLSYTMSYKIPYNEERVLEYRYEDFETYIAEIVDHEDQSLVLIEAKGDLES